MNEDVVNIKIKLLEDDLEIEDKKDLIVDVLKRIINKLEETNGNIQSAKMVDDFCSAEYRHVINLPGEE